MPGKLFAYHTVNGEGPITRWWIALRAYDAGTVVTQGFERVVQPDVDERAFESDLFGGRVAHNIANMAASLDRLADLVESG